ncbi:MAG: ATP-binding protein [Rhodothermaceae bacterium]|nr:ATP-binding protein [Rhodothermaceae bacterium]
MNPFRHHRLRVVVRVAFIAATVAGAGVLVWPLERYVLAGVLVLVAVWATARLVYYTEKPARDLTRFLESLRYDDVSQRFGSDRRGPIFRALSEAFEEVSTAIRQLRAEREEQARYLQTVVRHVGVALIAFRPDGTVALINHTARRLLGVARLRTIEGLRPINPQLTDTLLGLHTGERALIRTERGDEAMSLLMHAAQFRLRGAPYTLVSLQDIHVELEEQEMQAWQQLTRVLTHEIANSVAPIASLAGTASDRLRNGVEATESTTDVREALATIERRSNGLMHFIEAYRSLTRIPKPEFTLFPVRELFDDVATLLQTSFGAGAVTLETEVDPKGLELAADRELVEQVLINLLLNALQALEGRRGNHVALRARAGVGGTPIIEVEDDGPGVPDDALDRIFVPFYTTKPTGSGIGLSLSRQVMRLHGGRLRVRSKPGQTIFTLHF